MQPKRSTIPFYFERNNDGDFELYENNYDPVKKTTTSRSFGVVDTFEDARRVITSLNFVSQMTKISKIFQSAEG